MNENTEDIRKQKIMVFENFLNDVLKADLGRVVEERDKVVSEINEYNALETTIKALKEADLTTQPLRTKIDLGCNFYVQANVPDASMIYVAVGYGFFVEFTLDEALKFIDRKVAELKKNLDRLSKDSAKVKANIKLVLQGLRELQLIDVDSDKDSALDLFV